MDAELMAPNMKGPSQSKNETKDVFEADHERNSNGEIGRENRASANLAVQ